MRRPGYLGSLEDFWGVRRLSRFGNGHGNGHHRDRDRDRERERDRDRERERKKEERERERSRSSRSAWRGSSSRSREHERERERYEPPRSAFPPRVQVPSTPTSVALPSVAVIPPLVAAKQGGDVEVIKRKMAEALKQGGVLVPQAAPTTPSPAPLTPVTTQPFPTDATQFPAKGPILYQVPGMMPPGAFVGPPGVVRRPGVPMYPGGIRRAPMPLKPRTITPQMARLGKVAAAIGAGLLFL